MTHIVTLSGPSLSGKTELAKLLQKEGFHNVISVTTRPQRAQEKEGVDYRFISKEEYESLVLIQKTAYNGFFYGVSEQEIIEHQEQPIVWVVAPSSIAQIENYCLSHGHKLTKVFISNPEEVLMARLFDRFRNDKDAQTSVYVKRLQSMMNHERQWIMDAQSNVHQYDIRVEKFNEDNQNEVLEKVKEAVGYEKRAKMKMK